jgi:hypothetical protein
MSDIRKLLESFDSMVKEDDDVILMGDQFDIELQEHFVISTGVVGFMADGVIVQGDDALFEFLDLNGVLLESMDSESIEVSEDSEEYYLDEQVKIRYVLAMVALLAGLWGVEHNFAKKAYENSEQLQQLLHHYSRAEAEGDRRMMDQLEDRIRTQKFRLQSGRGEVRGPDFEPIKVIYDKEGLVPEKPDTNEAKYQGRTVSLNKPMKGDVAKSKVYVKNAKGNVVKVNFGDKDMKIKKSNPKRRKSFRARHNCDNPGPKWKARYWSCRAW